MSDVLNDGVQWLEEQQKSFNSRSITYTRGATSLTLSATVGQTTWNLDDGTGATISYESRDFLVLVDDLTLGLPAAGDRIADDGVTYEVAGPSAAEPAWRYTDRFRRRLRIHTKAVA